MKVSKIEESPKRNPSKFVDEKCLKRVEKERLMKLKEKASSSENGLNKNNSSSAVDLPKMASSTFSYFYSILPKDILGVPVNEIKKDIADGQSQIKSL
jgi:hypothetical protein